MGESVVEAPNVGYKKSDSISSSASLEVSVSFGRFENDSLSWEKWSTFSPNKYLEEVEKCSTPGSVAQKKAYFEAHYKRIAARKAEELEQERQMETNCFSKEVRLDDEEHDKSTSGSNPGVADFQSSVEEFQKAIITPECENLLVDEDHAESTCESNPEFSMADFQSSAEEVEQATIALECENQLANEAKEEINGKPDSLELGEPDEAVLVQEEARIEESREKVEVARILFQEDSHPDESQDKVQSPIYLEKETRNAAGNKKQKQKLDGSSKLQKITGSIKERNLVGTKKKTASPLPKKPLEISTPKKTSRLASISTVSPASQSSAKKANGSSLPRGKNLSAGERKKVVPSSLHMSLSLSLESYDATSVTTPRKSLIMEKMGHKEIVKRAFKTFQNNYFQVRDSGGERSSEGMEVSNTRPEKKLSTSLNPRKENETIRKVAGKMDAQRAQLGRSWNTTSVRSIKGAGMDQRNAKPASSSFGLKSDERAEKRKEFSKKLEGKSNAKESAKTHHISQSKGQKDAEIKQLRQSHNFKATPMPRSCHGHATQKSALDKECAEKEHHHPQELRR